MAELIPEEIDFEYSLGNIILSNHIQLERRIKMVKEIMEGHGYTHLAKSQECPECGGTEIEGIRLRPSRKVEVDKLNPCPTCQKEKLD